jgi:hypothetical protein
LYPTQKKKKKQQEYIPEDMAGLFKKVSEPKKFEDGFLEDDIVTQFNISLCGMSPLTQSNCFYI